MKRYKDVSWDEKDLISCKQAACIILKEYGEDIFRELEEQGEFGNLDLSDILDV